MAKTITKLSIAVGSALLATMAAGLAPAQAALLNFTLNTTPAPGNGSLDPITFTLDTSKTGVPNGNGNGSKYAGAISNLKFDNLPTLPGFFDLITSGSPGSFTYNIPLPPSNDPLVPNNLIFGGFTGATSDLSVITSLTANSFNNLTNFKGQAAYQGIGNPITGIVVGAGPMNLPPNPINTVPESNPTASLLALGALGAGATLLRKMSKKASLTTV